MLRRPKLLMVSVVRRSPSSARPLRLIDPGFRAYLADLGARYAARGVRLFVFGSAARHWPQAPLGADLDLGYELTVDADAASVRDALARELANRPSIRPVDLVDFGTVTEAFRIEALRHVVELAPHAALATAR